MPYTRKQKRKQRQKRTELKVSTDTQENKSLLDTISDLLTHPHFDSKLIGKGSKGDGSTTTTEPNKTTVDNWFGKISNADLVKQLKEELARNKRGAKKLKDIQIMDLKKFLRAKKGVIGELSDKKQSFPSEQEFLITYVSLLANVNLLNQKGVVYLPNKTLGDKIYVCLFRKIVEMIQEGCINKPSVAFKENAVEEDAMKIYMATAQIDQEYMIKHLIEKQANRIDVEMYKGETEIISVDKEHYELHKEIKDYNFYSDFLDTFGISVAPKEETYDHHFNENSFLIGPSTKRGRDDENSTPQNNTRKRRRRQRKDFFNPNTQIQTSQDENVVKVAYTTNDERFDAFKEFLEGLKKINLRIRSPVTYVKRINEKKLYLKNILGEQNYKQLVKDNESNNSYSWFFKEPKDVDQTHKAIKELKKFFEERFEETKRGIQSDNGISQYLKSNDKFMRVIAKAIFAKNGMEKETEASMVNIQRQVEFGRELLNGTPRMITTTTTTTTEQPNNNATQSDMSYRMDIDAPEENQNSGPSFFGTGSNNSSNKDQENLDEKKQKLWGLFDRRTKIIMFKYVDEMFEISDPNKWGAGPLTFPHVFHRRMSDTLRLNGDPIHTIGKWADDLHSAYNNTNPGSSSQPQTMSGPNATKSLKRFSKLLSFLGKDEFIMGKMFGIELDTNNPMGIPIVFNFMKEIIGNLAHKHLLLRSFNVEKSVVSNEPSSEIDLKKIFEQLVVGKFLHCIKKIKEKRPNNINGKEGLQFYMETNIKAISDVYSEIDTMRRGMKRNENSIKDLFKNISKGFSDTIKKRYGAISEYGKSLICGAYSEYFMRTETLFREIFLKEVHAYDIGEYASENTVLENLLDEARDRYKQVLFYDIIRNYCKNNSESKTGANNYRLFGGDLYIEDYVKTEEQDKKNKNMLEKFKLRRDIREKYQNALDYLYKQKLQHYNSHFFEQNENNPQPSSENIRIKEANAEKMYKIMESAMERHYSNLMEAGAEDPIILSKLSGEKTIIERALKYHAIASHYNTTTNEQTRAKEEEYMKRCIKGALNKTKLAILRNVGWKSEFRENLLKKLSKLDNKYEIFFRENQNQNQSQNQNQIFTWVPSAAENDEANERRIKNYTETMTNIYHKILEEADLLNELTLILLPGTGGFVNLSTFIKTNGVKTDAGDGIMNTQRNFDMRNLFDDRISEVTVPDLLMTNKNYLDKKMDDEPINLDMMLDVIKEQDVKWDEYVKGRSENWATYTISSVKSMFRSFMRRIKSKKFIELPPLENSPGILKEIENKISAAGGIFSHIGNFLMRHKWKMLIGFITAGGAIAAYMYWPTIMGSVDALGRLIYDSTSRAKNTIHNSVVSEINGNALHDGYSPARDAASFYKQPTTPMARDPPHITPISNDVTVPNHASGYSPFRGAASFYTQPITPMASDPPRITPIPNSAPVQQPTSGYSPYRGVASFYNQPITPMANDPPIVTSTLTHGFGSTPSTSQTNLPRAPQPMDLPICPIPDYNNAHTNTTCPAENLYGRVVDLNDVQIANQLWNRPGTETTSGTQPTTTIETVHSQGSTNPASGFTNSPSSYGITRYITSAAVTFFVFNQIAVPVASAVLNSLVPVHVV